MTTSIHSSIEILKKAQELDREIYLADQQLKALPEEKLRIKSELEMEKNHLRELEAALKKAQLAQKDKEGLLAQKEANIKKLDGQLSQVKTNKEYSAMQQEIASLKADNSLLEEEIIKLIDVVEAAEDEVKDEKERLKAVEKDFLSRETEMAQKEKTFAENIERLKKQRVDIMGQVPQDISTLYDLIVQKKQGMGLAKITGDNCAGCRLQLRAQLLNEVRMGMSLIVCENCSRILYFED